MKTTIDLDSKLLKKAQRLAEVDDKNELLHKAILALIHQAQRERLLKRLGTMELTLSHQTLKKFRNA